MNQSIIKVEDLHKAVEELNKDSIFKSFGLTHEASVFNNWAEGKDEDYPEFILDIVNYSEEEMEADMGLQLGAMFGALCMGMSANTGDSLILVDDEVAGTFLFKAVKKTNRITGLIVVDGQLDNIKKDIEVLPRIQEIVNDLIKNNELFEGFESVFNI